MLEDEMRQKELARLQEQNQRALGDKSNIRKLIKMKAVIQ
jgi:hypothetical protein